MLNSCLFDFNFNPKFDLQLKVKMDDDLPELPSEKIPGHFSRDSQLGRIVFQAGSRLTKLVQFETKDRADCTLYRSKPFRL